MNLAGQSPHNITPSHGESLCGKPFYGDPCHGNSSINSDHESMDSPERSSPERDSSEWHILDQNFESTESKLPNEGTNTLDREQAITQLLLELGHSMASQLVHDQASVSERATTLRMLNSIASCVRQFAQARRSRMTCDGQGAPSLPTIDHNMLVALRAAIEGTLTEGAFTEETVPNGIIRDGTLAERNLTKRAIPEEFSSREIE